MSRSPRSSWYRSTAALFVALNGIEKTLSASWTRVTASPGAWTILCWPVEGDVLVGSCGADVIFGMDGDDILCGFKCQDFQTDYDEGDDYLHGGDDNDRICDYDSLDYDDFYGGNGTNYCEHYFSGHDTFDNCTPSATVCEDAEAWYEALNPW